MSISNDLFVRLEIQDIINANNNGVVKLSFNTLFDIENMANFYIMGFSFSLTHHHFKKSKYFIIKGNIS